jgi:hypothetical protein
MNILANRATRTRYLEQLSHEYGSIIRYEWLMIGIPEIVSEEAGWYVK